MDDLSIDIVKDNIYYIKSPFKGEIIRFFADIGDSVEKGKTVALFKTIMDMLILKPNTAVLSVILLAV